VRGQARAQRGLVELHKAQAEVVQVTAVARRAGAALAADRAVQRDKVDQRRASAQLQQAQLRLPFFEGAA